ncbi:MAG: TonB-dependent receptor [Planctomycetes bacterium]|nr:TonB-dependent receptor [Planctomycetota bacterium]
MSFFGFDRKFTLFLGMLLIILMATGVVFAGTTGKIAGKIIDKNTGEPLPGVNVVIQGTTMGNATDSQGRFTIINIRPGDYTISATIMGYAKVTHEDVHVTADLTTAHDLAMSEEVLDGEVIVIKAERPLVQRDQTSSVRVTSAEEIAHLPVRDYQEVVSLSAGVVTFAYNVSSNQGRKGNAAANESGSNLPDLNIRGGRANQVAYIVDGFSVQDPISGRTTTTITPGAIQEVVIMTGGFNAEYGRIMSGAVNVTTKRGQKKYHGKVSAITDNVGFGSDPQDYNIYDMTLSGPLIPGNDKINFFVSGSRAWMGSRQARANMPQDIYKSIASPPVINIDDHEVAPWSDTHRDEVAKLQDGVLPSNSNSNYAWHAKLGIDLSDNLKIDLGTLGSRDNFQRYQTTWLFGLEHCPVYDDRNSAINGKVTYQMNKNTFMTFGANFFASERFRGDGLYKEDQTAYGRPGGNPGFDSSTLFMQWDDMYGVTVPDTTLRGWSTDEGEDGWGAEAADWDSVGFITMGYEGAVFDDYLKRKSSYIGLDFDITSQVHPYHEIKLGFDTQQHELHYYRNLFPTNSWQYMMSQKAGDLDVDQYGYTWDARQNKLVEEDPGGGGLNDYDKAKEPRMMAFYFQDKFEYKGLVLNMGMRWDYLDVNTEQLTNPDQPFQGDSSLDPDEDFAGKADAQTAFSPRLGIGFPVTDRTVLHASFGHFYQQPNLFDLYVSYRYLESKISRGGYYYQVGNPNLDWEKTIAYEVGIRHQLNATSVVEVTSYYKSIEDLVQARAITSTPESHESYRNDSFSTVRGFDFSFQTLRTSNIATSLAYSLSWATGTGSDPSSTRNIVWQGEEPPVLHHPLDFDQRHKFTFNFDYRFASNAPTPLLNQAGVNFLGNFASGKPYTAANLWNETTLGAGASEPFGPLNGRNAPWTFRVDMKANKLFNISGLDMNFYVWVLNLLDRNNPIAVYDCSGDPTTTTYLDGEEGQTLVEELAVPDDNSGLTGEEKYLLRENDPRMFDTPRVVRFGFELSF